MTTRLGWRRKNGTFWRSASVMPTRCFDLLPGVDPNGPALVWPADQFLILRRGECLPAHAMTL
jgi:hypothetical protein